MDLINKVENYYKNNFESLSLDKQFHFASRLSAWKNDTFSKKYLGSVVNDYTHGGDNKTIREDLLDLINNPPKTIINASKTREPYFKKYPFLRGQMLALFRVRHLLYIFDYDARNILLDILPREQLLENSLMLQKDIEAVKVLSTYAINYIYLVGLLYDESFDYKKFNEEIYELHNNYDKSSAIDLQLLIYLYTHCIIGESNFYLKQVKSNDCFNKMLSLLENCLVENFENINLDNKLEFLVCCQILGRNSILENKIMNECQQSASPNGDFLIDTINNNKQSSKTTLDLSEHRNVLFIMSGYPYPHLSK